MDTKQDVACCCRGGSKVLTLSKMLHVVVPGGSKILTLSKMLRVVY